jgi:hypothetical protein
MEVYILFNTKNNSVYLVYQDKEDAKYWKNTLNEMEDKFIIIESFMFIVDESKFHYSEEDSNVDEEEYYKLKNKVKEQDDIIINMKKEYNELKELRVKDNLYLCICLIIYLFIHFIL